MFDQGVRMELADQIESSKNKLSHCIKLIAEYLATNEYSADIQNGLTNISSNLAEYHDELTRLHIAVLNNEEDFQVKEIPEYDIWATKLLIENVRPTNHQKKIVPTLVKYLDEIHGFLLPEYLKSLNNPFKQCIRVIYGAAGTGKTHGLANCVEKHLAADKPALIIQAKGTPCNNWTEILSNALELSGWNKNEILNALEAMAVSHDVAAVRQNTATSSETAKVLICIDGLEEEPANEPNWISRISETELLSKQHPRVRFLFSGREYFPTNIIDDTRVNYFKSIHLPPEGDVPVYKVAEDYFREFDITLEDHKLAGQLDSLLALRLFCDLYKGRTISTGEQIVTVTGDLLNAKIKLINQEFLQTLATPKSATQEPVFDALITIAENFYHTNEIEHDVLRQNILAQVGASFDAAEIDIMLDFFENHGILIRSSRKSGTGALAKTIYSYRITYQTIIEHVLSEKIFSDIDSGNLQAIPPILRKGMSSSTKGAYSGDPYQEPPNQQIIQNIVDRLLSEKNKLIGDNDFLTDGFSPEQIEIMRLKAIAAAPPEIAIAYKDEITKRFLDGPESQMRVLSHVIYPSSIHANSTFGSIFLHELLMTQPTAYARDVIWSGYDGYDRPEGAEEYENNVKEILDYYGTGIYGLSEYDDYNESPLFFAWALSNIDQSLRDGIRVALTKWASKRPDQFVKLLDTIFFCNDPQIQEDLASIALGLAGLLKDQAAVKQLATWSLENIISRKNDLRNVVIRHGFRAVVEKAVLLKQLSSEEAEMARPSRMTNPPLIDFDYPLPAGSTDEIYPITHDLAWYVLGKSFDGFLEHPFQMANHLEDKDCPEAKVLLDVFRNHFAAPDIYAYSWAMSAALGYIKVKLGLIRTDGNGFTDQTHGSKSKVFTYEEKYTWLAVHHLQGYLSDYIPFSEAGDNRAWITDYSQLAEIPNPGEQVAQSEMILDHYTMQNKWIVNADIAPTIQTTGDVAENIRLWTESEPSIDFAKWITFNSEDFDLSGPQKRFIALKNVTNLEDASGHGYSRITITGCLIKPASFAILKNIVETDPDKLFFTKHSDGFKAMPDTHTYSNPSDIVWMDWIPEIENEETFFNQGDEHKINFTVTKVTQASVKGEKYYSIPSKLVRHLLGITSFKEPVFANANEEIIGYLHQISNSTHDFQKLLAVDEKLFLENTEAAGLVPFWWVEVFKSKNALYEQINHLPHFQRTFKYLVWLENGEFKHINFWNERFSNQRDREDESDEADDTEDYETEDNVDN